VIERAYSRMNERDYSLFNNNCEHFARWCKCGVAGSEQVSDKVAGASGVGLGSAAVAGGLGAVSAGGAVAGMSAAGMTSGLAAVGGTMVTGLGVLAAAPAAVTTVTMRHVLKDDEALPQEERDARQAGRAATVVGAGAGAAGALGAVAAAGVPGLSAVGITSGLGAIGASVGGGMATGIAMTVAAPAVAAAAVGYGIYKLFGGGSKQSAPSERTSASCPRCGTTYPSATVRWCSSCKVET
jgi:hypothetical protein